MWKQQVALRNALGDPWPTMVTKAHGSVAEDRMTLVEAMAEAQRLGSQRGKSERGQREIAEQAILTAMASAEAATVLLLESSRGASGRHSSERDARPTKVARRQESDQSNPVELLECERRLLEKRATSQKKASGGSQADAQSPKKQNPETGTWQESTSHPLGSGGAVEGRTESSASRAALETVREEAMDEGEEGEGASGGAGGGGGANVHIDVDLAAEAVSRSRRMETDHGQGAGGARGAGRAKGCVVLNGGSFSQPFSLPQVTGLPKSPPSPAQSVTSTHWSQPFFAPSNNSNFSYSREADDTMQQHTGHHQIRTQPLTHASLFATIKQLKKGGDDEEPPAALSDSERALPGATTAAGRVLHRQ